MTSPQFLPFLITPDTNVLVSGGTTSIGAPSQIINAWRKDNIDFALSPSILDEVEDVLSRPYFKQHAGWTNSKITQYVKELGEGSYIFPGTTLVTISTDPYDNMLFSTALEAKASYIVSGDKKHVIPIKEFKGIKVMGPRAFIDKVLRKLK